MKLHYTRQSLSSLKTFIIGFPYDEADNDFGEYDNYKGQKMLDNDFEDDLEDYGDEEEQKL